ncbi:MAG: T9SS type A sorting domain-containing protein [Saprospiraceae bacterium]
MKLILQAAFTIFLFCSSFFSNAQWQFLGCPEFGTPLDFDSDGDTLYVCASAGIFYSVDEAMTWHEIRLPDSTLSPNMIDVENGSLYLSTRGITNKINKLFRSYDLGATWVDISPEISQLQQPFTHILTKEDTLIIYMYDSIAISFNNGDSYVVDSFANYENLFFHQQALWATKYNGFYRSDDLGITWTSIYTEPDSLFLFQITSIEGALWKTATDFNLNTLRLSRSGDNGLTWLPVNSIPTDSLGFYSPYVIGDNEKLYVVDHTQSNRLYYSEDNGQTWQGKNIPEYSSEPLLNHNLLLYKNYRGIYVSTDGGDIFRSANNGFTAASVQGFAWDGQNVWVKANLTMFKENNNEWLPVENTYSVVSSTDGHLLGFVDNLPKRSSDGGATWTTIPPQAFDMDYYPNFRSFMVAGNILYVSASLDTWYSTDYGVTWNFENNRLAVVKYNEKYLASTYLFGGLLISDDGIQWQDITYDLDNAFNPNALGYNNGFIFTSTDAGLFRLSVFSEHWELLNGPIPNDPIHNFYQDVRVLEGYNGILIAGVYGFGVFISNDNGDTWQSANQGLDNFKILSSVMIGNDLYMGVEGGVWKRPLSDLIASTFPQPEKKLSVIISPAPAKDYFYISILNPAVRGDLFLSIYDSTGSLIKSSHFQNPLNNRIDVQEFPSGMYFLQYRIGEYHDIMKVVKQ